MLPCAVRFVLVAVPQIPFPDGIALYLAAQFLLLCLNVQGLLGPNAYGCVTTRQKLRWETVLIGEHLRDCARSSEAFWESRYFYIYRDDMCTSPAHADTLNYKKTPASSLSCACYNKSVACQVLSVSRAQSKTP